MIKSQKQTDSWLKWHAITLISGWILTAIAYGNIINSFFLSDDFNWIYQIKTKGAFGVWTTPPDVFFRPLISLTLFADYQLWELNPLVITSPTYFSMA
ncbi:hypothetical protein AP9108_34270 [Arthrospira sp. PCC 9108]|nr:hypothetical protein AP9108_34270 [Arthrospira sp. PCC 9108]